MGKDKLKIEGMVSLNQAITRIEELLDSLRNGVIHFQFGDESLTLNPPDILDLELKASKKKKEQKISLELSWECQDSVSEKEIKIGSPEAIPDAPQK